ncbi:ninein isoform X10 [Equus quagga]|uniref:ninein isoform X10 n=1 Tax=Equus quagga TaxID=89248 RepID=UPI001EE2B6F2|nr:ninein isoform X10 [Equus quagga]
MDEGEGGGGVEREAANSEQSWAEKYPLRGAPSPAAGDVPRTGCARGEWMRCGPVSARWAGAEASVELVGESLSLQGCRVESRALLPAGPSSRDGRGAPGRAAAEPSGPAGRGRDRAAGAPCEREGTEGGGSPRAPAPGPAPPDPRPGDTQPRGRATGRAGAGGGAGRRARAVPAPPRGPGSGRRRAPIPTPPRPDPTRSLEPRARPGRGPREAPKSRGAESKARTRVVGGPGAGPRRGRGRTEARTARGRAARAEGRAPARRGLRKDAPRARSGRSPARRRPRLPARPRRRARGPQVSAVGYGMDEAEQDQHEARLKELFDSFDTTGTGSLGQEELTDLCHMLSLEEVAPVLQETLLQDNLLGRVHFDQFKEALILILSRTLSNEEHFQEPDCSLEAQPKYVRGGKRYGRRSLPEFQESVEEFAEVTVIEPLGEEARPSHVPTSDHDEHWKTQHSEEYEAEGQLRFWNPDDLNASQSGSSPPQNWIEEKLQEVCEDLGITRDGHLNRKKLVSICEQYGLQSIDGEMLEEVFHNLDPDGTMSVEDFFYGLFKNGKSLPPSASTPYRQLKRHLSMQSFDESGRRTTTPSAMMSTIGFRVFSCLDDGMGYASVEKILDTWQEEGIENSQEILKALDFSLDGNVNLTELTLALENELLVTKNGLHQAALASFKAEIRHLLERVDQVVREKEKLRSDLDKAEKLKSLMASEVDDHHAAIERRNEYNLRKLDEEYKERIAALKSELRKEREQILQQVGKQRLELEQEIEKAKTEENYLRDRLALSLKENSRLENELLENVEKLAEYENLTNKLQRNLDNVLAEKFGDLDPSSAEFFLQEERLTHMRNEYEQQCRVLQDQVDELQSELEEYRTQGKVFRLPLKNSLSEELDGHSGCTEPDRGLGSEECNPLNMSIEAELAIEQMKEQHRRDLCRLRLELEDKVHHYEKQLDETKVACEKEQESMRQKYENEVHTLEKQRSDLKKEIAELQGQAAVLKEAQQTTTRRHEEEKKQLHMKWDEEKTQLQEKLRLEHEMELKARLEQAEESLTRERDGLAHEGAWTEEKVRGLTQELEHLHQEQLKGLVEKHTLEKEELRKEFLEKHQRELQEGRYESEKLQEENSILRSEITTLNEEDSMSNLKLGKLNGSQEEMWQKIETVEQEKAAVQKMVENLKTQISELKTKNQQLNLENTELSQKNSQNQKELQDLNQRLAAVLCQEDNEPGHSALEEWEQEKSHLREELERCKVQSSTLVSSLEAELSEVKIQTHIVEQENLLLKGELETLKQLAKSRLLEHRVATVKREQRSWEQQSESLRSQLTASQQKVQSLEDTLQNVNLQMSRIKADLRVTQQEKEALKQEVMSLHKRLQSAGDKNWAPEIAAHPSGFRKEPQSLPWDKLDHLMHEEQQLLWQESERLQAEVQHPSAELAHSRGKVRQLESNLLPPKHQKHLNSSGTVKPIEQEKLSLKRECEQIQKELSPTSRKVSQMNSLERELETIHLENEGLKKKQVKLDEQLVEMQHLRAPVMRSPPPPTWDLQLPQQQACPTVPREQFLQLQRQLLQAERMNRHLQEELEHRTSETSTPQGNQEQLVTVMEERMMEVEQKLKLVKRLLQEKVNQLKEQLCKNTKADARVKDLYVENAQLLKALEMTEQRQKTAEKKNYLLEEKIASLSNIVRNLTPAPLTSAPPLRS